MCQLFKHKEKTLYGDVNMKINKITAIVCGTLTLFTGVGTVLLALFAPQTTGYAALQGIVSSVFSGFIVSLVVPTIGYFHERNMISKKQTVIFDHSMLICALFLKKSEKSCPKFHLQ